jgi:hypothetical protein
LGTTPSVTGWDPLPNCFINAANTAKAASQPVKKPKAVEIGRGEESTELAIPRPRLVDLVFEWMAERHAAAERRATGMPAPWTRDHSLHRYSFCNVFRVLDRHTQFQIAHVINVGAQDTREAFFRVALFRLFNRMSTWEHLVAALGVPTWADFDLTRYQKVLDDVRADGHKLYTGSYQLITPDQGGGSAHANSLRILKQMMDADLPKLIAECRYSADAFHLIVQFPGYADFMANQCVFVTFREFPCPSVTVTPFSASPYPSNPRVYTNTC